MQFPVNMFKTPFPRLSITESFKYINKKVRLYVNNNQGIPQLAICRVTIEHKKVDLLCPFLVVPRNCPALPEMPAVRN